MRDEKVVHLATQAGELGRAAERSNWKAAIDAFAKAELRTRGGTERRDGLETLLQSRKPLLARIPAGSEIWLVEFNEVKFRELLTLCDKPRSSLVKVAERINSAGPGQRNEDGERAWAHAKDFSFSCLNQACLLFGHSIDGPLTILDGTHRAIAGYLAVVLYRRIAFSSFRGFVAVSDEACYFHGPDLVNYQERDDLVNLEEIIRRYYSGK